MQIRHNITLDEEVSKELETMAKELGEKKSKIIEKALTVYFDLLDQRNYLPFAGIHDRLYMLFHS